MNSFTIYNVILCTSLLLTMSGSGSPVTIGDTLSYFYLCLTKTVNQNQLNDSAYLEILLWVISAVWYTQVSRSVLMMC